MPDETKTSFTQCPQCGQPVAGPNCMHCGACDELGGDKTLSMDVGGPSVQPHDNDPLIGLVIEQKFRIVAKLGHGTMGHVYQARRTNKLPDVAIKFIDKQLVSDAAAVERFGREAQIAAEVDHPNVVRIYDWTKVEDDDLPAFIVMELVKGTTLASILRKQTLTIARAVALMCEICKGVGAAHQKGVIHRDVKPANVMICLDGAGDEKVKILDFGLAKLHKTADVALTAQGYVVGTPVYMSPEQFEGGELDARSDVYSLATVMYEMLTGAPPFMGKSINSLRNKHAREAPRPFAASLRIPNRLKTVVLTALSKDRAKRPVNADEFGRALREAADAHPLPKPRPLNTRPDRFDFGIISTDPDVFKSIRDVLGLRMQIPANQIGGNTYLWGKIQTDEGKHAYVVQAMPVERQAHANDGEILHDMIEVCDPELILILGTARGLRAAGSQLGQVVYSRLVRSASSRTFDRNDFCEAGNLPPDARLIHLASSTENDHAWRRAVRARKRDAKPPDPKFNVASPIATEVFSTPNGHDDYSSQLVQTIQSFYPRVAAIESEAASVAHTLLRMVQRGRSIGYLMIKGISDIIDDETPPEERKQRSQSWTPYASFAAATVAHSLIRRWRPAERRGATIPAAYREVLNGADHNSRAHVFHRLHPERYSQLCNIVCSDENGVKKVFAVCEFEPAYFVGQLARYCRCSAEDLMKLDDNAFLDHANGVFPHFEAFRSLSNKGIEVNRVVLAKDSRDEWYRRNTALNVKLFLRLNGDVACYLAEAPVLRSENLLHITDHVIFNSKLMLDYYDDSQTLIMTYDEDGLDSERVKFEKHFDTRKQLEYLYSPLKFAPFD